MEQLSNYRRFRRIMEKIGVYYKFLFWKLEYNDGVFTVKSRMWLHNVKDVLISPVYLVAFLCAGIIALFDATAYERKLHVPRNGGKFSKPQLRAAKFHLLTSLTLICLILTSCGAIDPATRTAKYQEPRQYGAWYQDQLTLWQKMFGKKAKDPRVIQAEVELAKNKWQLEKQAEEEKIVKQVESIKSKIK